MQISDANFAFFELNFLEGINYYKMHYTSSIVILHEGVVTKSMNLLVMDILKNKLQSQLLLLLEICEKNVLRKFILVASFRYNVLSP